jgi:hypothetical protein
MVKNWQGVHDSALSCLRLDSYSDQAYFLLGLAFANSNYYDQAVAAFRSAVKCPNCSDGINSIFLYI